MFDFTVPEPRISTQYRVDEKGRRYELCVECGTNDSWSRSLCNGCYSRAQRADELNDYPNRHFLDNPESHIRWALGYYPNMVAEIAAEYNLALVDPIELR